MKARGRRVNGARGGAVRRHACTKTKMEPVDPEGYVDFPICPVGSQYQAKIPKLATKDQHRELMTSSGYDYPVVIGLALPITWESTSEVDNKNEKLQMQMMLETEARASNRDDQSQANPMMQQKETKALNPLPCYPMAPWSDLEAKLFLLGLYIFGKNLNLVSKFLGTKTVGDVLSYYYGNFNKKTDAYKRWAECRKAKSKKCIIGKQIFQRPRLPELISRMKSNIPEEAHASLIEVFKSFSGSEISFEEFVFTLKSIVGTESFVEAVGIGKGKHDLTGFVMADQSKPSKPDLTAGKDCSSLASEDIIKFLTGGFRRSKTRSNDFFWEIVWPRLLAKGWQSEQPNDVRSTKNCLVFLMPGIKKFSRSKLTKGTDYFDSVSDVLKKVVADPVLLELEADGTENGFPPEKNVCITDMKLKQDSPLDEYQEVQKFTIIHTSLVEDEEPFNVRELRNLPTDANINFAISYHLPNMASDSSLEEQDAGDGLSYDQGDPRRVTADLKKIEMAPAGSLKKMMTGHSSNDRDDTIDLGSTYRLKMKSKGRKYLSPVAKRRKLARRSDKQTSRRAVSFSKGVDLEKEKIKHLTTSSKPTAGGGGTSQTKSMASCSTKKRACKPKMGARNSLSNDWSDEKMSKVKLIEIKPYQGKEDSVPEAHSKITLDETKIAKGRSQVSAVIDSNKQETPDVDKARGRMRITPSDNHGGMKADEAPSIPDCNNKANDHSEETERSASPQPEHANSQRHGTRNRPLTAKALEAIAFGYLGSGKRKGGPKNTATNRPSQRARKATKGFH